jgi:hypothetical protein
MRENAYHVSIRLQWLWPSHRGCDGKWWNLTCPGRSCSWPAGPYGSLKVGRQELVPLQSPVANHHGPLQAAQLASTSPVQTQGLTCNKVCQCFVLLWSAVCPCWDSNPDRLNRGSSATDWAIPAGAHILRPQAAADHNKRVSVSYLQSLPPVRISDPGQNQLISALMANFDIVRQRQQTLFPNSILNLWAPWQCFWLCAVNVLQQL